MSEKLSSSSSSGIGIGGLIFVVLMVGKLAGFFPNVSWFWAITSIVWGPVLGFLVVFLFLGIGAGIVVVGAAALGTVEKKRLKNMTDKYLGK